MVLTSILGINWRTFGCSGFRRANNAARFGPPAEPPWCRRSAPAALRRNRRYVPVIGDADHRRRQVDIEAADRGRVAVAVVDDDDLATAIVAADFAAAY